MIDSAKNGEESQLSVRSPVSSKRVTHFFPKLGDGFDVVLLCIVYRIIALLLLRTAFVPDEYYQSVEPAFSFAFSDNNNLVIPPLTWEWQSEYRIRSYIPILHYIQFFRILQLLDIDCEFFVRNGPRFIQTLYSIIGDISLYSTCKMLFTSEDTVRDIVIVNLFSWSGTYCMGRTLINSYETVLQNVGTWLWIICIKNGSKKTWYNVLFIVLVTVSIYSRPTSILWWVIPMLVYLIMDKKRVVHCALIGLCTCVVCTMIDSYHYNTAFNYPDNCLYDYNGCNKIIQFFFDQICELKVTITPLNFYIYNVHRNYAALFGSKPWYWTLVEGLPVMSGFYFPFVFYEIFIYTTRGFRSITDATLLNYLVFSALFYAIALRAITSHQEYRFLLPCLPALHVLLGVRYNQLNRKRSKLRILFLLSFVLNVILASVLLTSHQNGAENSFKYLVRHVKTKFRDTQVPTVINVYIAAPCYSFPGYSYLYDHYQSNIQIRLHYFKCFPLQKQHVIYANDIYHSLKREVIDDSVNDSFCNQVNYLVTFDAYKDVLSGIIDNEAYHELYTARHSFFKYDYDDLHESKFVHIYSQLEQSCSIIVDLVNL